MRDQTDNVEMVLANRACSMQILKCLYISSRTHEINRVEYVSGKM